jgi:fructose-1,6-bisphosphatase/inositol monophosphatase family enzyme
MSLELEGLIMVVNAGMYEVKTDQGRPAETILKPQDGTLVTKTDKRSQQSMLRMLHGMSNLAVSQLPVYAEEAHGVLPESGKVILIDPLDGTGAFANGLATSTVIAAIYDTSAKKVEACVIGEVSTGRIWLADASSPTKLKWGGTCDDDTVKVGKGWTDRTRAFGGKDYIFLDVAHSFNKGLNVTQMAFLLKSLVTFDIKFHVPGSNGLIHALVANGASSAAGSISTAKGGPWDFCGALLVKQAGGFVQGYRKTADGLVEHNALDPVGCDFLVTANSSRILKQLFSLLLAAY